MVLFQRGRSKSSPPGFLNVGYGGSDDEEQNVYQRGKNSKNQYSSSCSRKTGQNSINFSPFRIIQAICFGLICLQFIRSHKNVQNLNMEMFELQGEYESSNIHIVGLEQELDSAHGDFYLLQMKLLAGNSNEQTHHAGLSESERKAVTDKIIEKQEHQVDRIDQLQKRIQKNYEVELRRRYVLSMLCSLSSI
jgi:lipopolysaccharide export LptBFGC system permease protein LptF